MSFKESHIFVFSWLFFVFSKANLTFYRNVDWNKFDQNILVFNLIIFIWSLLNCLDWNKTCAEQFCHFDQEVHKFLLLLPSLCYWWIIDILSPTSLCCFFIWLDLCSTANIIVSSGCIHFCCLLQFFAMMPISLYCWCHWYILV